ncbi:MAG: hypothetical protein A2Z72_03315 [Omnitrophica bacterium RBG_13_46_9]|nr:MAG: hypothetical protein A2Z72_03315 [Omnitrophica bacterium RBG_13_46_9]
MKQIGLIAVVGIFLILGCATVKVQSPKEPIKVDITMRLDVYQHVQKDINSIEDIVTGADKGQKVPGQQSFLYRFVETAYAQELSPEVEQAALRRKDRRGELISLEQAGTVGETSLGLVVIRGSADASAEKIVNAENSDRMVIYNEIASKNGTSVKDVQKLYAERIQKDAPSGTPIEVGSGNWQIK